MNAKQFIIGCLDEQLGSVVVDACKLYVQQNGSLKGAKMKDRMAACGGNWVAMYWSAIPNKISRLCPDENIAYGGDQSGMASILFAQAVFNLLGGNVLKPIRDKYGRVVPGRRGLPWAGCSFD